MNFSYGKLTILRPQKEKKLQTFITALLTAAAIFVPYMILSEGYFTFFGDFNVQQIPFYRMCHAAVRSGNIGWSWTTDLGVNFIGSYSFYLLGSPFFWITLLFPNSFVPYLMGPLLILKFACAALTGYLYIRRFTKTADAAYLGGLLYAFSGFSVYNIFFNHFHEAIIVFPLLLLSVELLITENRHGVFAFMVCIAAVTNYFFFFGMVVFTVIYFFVRLFSGAIKVRASRFLVLLFEAVLGLAMSAILLIPSYFAVIDNSRISNLLMGWDGIMYGKEQIYLNIIECFFFPPDLPARPVFFPGAEVRWSSLGGWLPVFSMTGVFVWFINRKGSWLKRIIGICIFMAMVPILNSAFYAFNTSYYARWFYMPILMMCLATVMITEDSRVDWSSGFKWTLGITLAFVAVIGLFPQKDAESGKLIFGLYTQGDDLTYVVRFWLTSLIAVMSLVLLYLLIKLMYRKRAAFYKASVICVCIVSIIYANVFVATGRSHSYEIKDVMIDQLIEGSVSLEKDENYRIDVYDGVDNTGMYLGFPTINAFHSVVPASITEYYQYIGEERSVASRPDTELSAIRPFLSVKYLLNRTDGKSFVDDNGDTEMPGYEYVKTSGGYYVYENENYIPYGFSYNYYMSYDFCNSYSEESRTRLMLKAILLDDEQIEKYSDILADIKDLKVTESLAYSDTTLSLSDSAMADDCERLAETSADSFKIDNGGFTATVVREKKSLVFFSVPYEAGWSATVNGASVEIEKVNVGFMAVAVGEGESEIRFNYETPGLSTGVMITLGALTVFLVYFIISAFYLKHHSDKTQYPEGEMLLNEWHKSDIAEAAAEYSVKLDDFSDIKLSILDEPSSEDIHMGNSGFNGGFKIDMSAFDENDD